MLLSIKTGDLAKIKIKANVLMSKIRTIRPQRAMLESLLKMGEFITLLFVFTLILSKMALAYTVVEQSRVTLQPSEEKRIFVSIKNQTSYVWYGGSSKTSLYLYGTTSKFKSATWLKDDMPATIDQTSVAPGAVATASFIIKAPSTPGTYTERFLLGDGKTWHANTVVEFVFTVKTNTAVTATAAYATNLPGGSRIANTTAYNAQIIDLGGLEWQADLGAHMTVTIKVKNTGKQIWKQSGDGVVAVYAYDNKFKDFSWKDDHCVVSMNESSVSPNGTATFTMQLRAPDLPGSYRQNFELRVNSLESITASGFTLPIKVRAPDQFVTTQPSTQIKTQIKTQTSNTNVVSSKQNSGSYLAKLLLQPRGAFSVSGNATVSLQYGIKNNGTAVWNNQTIQLKEISPNLGTRLSNVQDPSWPNNTTAKVINTATEPGHLSLIDFKIKAPAKQGNYNVRFALVADGDEVEGGLIDIPITVTADGYIESETTNAQTANPTITNPDQANLPAEPIIRVGLYVTIDDTSVIRGVQTGFTVMQNGTPVCTFNQGEQAVLFYDRAHSVYKVTGPRCQSQSTNYYVAVADDGLSPLEVADLSRPVSWLPGANDNKFRAKLELRYTPKTDSVWLINELPLEYYLKGIAETSELSPIEFHKTLLVAARTYAMYHVEHATKHADEFFTVDAKYDQVYRGYGQEARSPTIARAIDETRGLVVTYQDRIAITPYFSRSDGRTRNWNEVWSGSVPWCIGVSVPEDNGKTLWGHGVGMSASGALEMAAHEGKTYDQILKYFYTGIDLSRWYK